MLIHSHEFLLVYTGQHKSSSFHFSSTAFLKPNHQLQKTSPNHRDQKKILIVALVDASSAYFMIFLHLIDLYYSLGRIETLIDFFFLVGRFRIGYILFTKEYFTSEVTVDNYYASFTDREPYCSRCATYQGPRIISTTTTIRKGNGEIETVEKDASRIRKTTRYADGNVMVEEKKKWSEWWKWAGVHLVLGICDFYKNEMNK
ncbi:hypothetical protein HII31_07999 [Pseudocercospora fuligena]|uniref:Uncharacterized protein n=1 Tax=Pseudocercospora fuligena TaxID=685502 RepID=A0A8H6VGQ4_9PEZI|nr:hypothetical protein HII31_07999 [Pseudocercospora fuligena]